MTSICNSVTTRPAEMALAVADIRIMGRVGGRAEETGTNRGMQGSSSPELPLLYSTAVTVRFFDAAPLALFAARLKGRRSLTAVCKSRRLASFAKATACQGEGAAPSLWGAHAPRHCELVFNPMRRQKPVSARRRNQHARRVRSPNEKRRFGDRRSLNSEGASGGEFCVANKAQIKFFVALRCS